ncbi:MAG: beta family protein, partial [Rhodanobacteraceae bacterium]
PVVAPLSLRGPGTSYFEAVSRVAARDKRGMALRVPSEDFASTAMLERVLWETVNFVSASPGDIDLYLDAESLARVPVEAVDEVALAESLRAAAEMTLRLGYRRVVFAASSMPDSLTRHERGKVMHIPQVEFRVWRRLASGPGRPSMLFGDYGVVYPTQTESNVPVRPPSRVRITTAEEHVLYKGRPEEIRTLSRRAVDDGALKGLADSWGASAVRECAAGYGNEGSATSWVGRDTNMHIENTVGAIIRHTAIEASVLSQIAAATAGNPWLQDSLTYPNSR